MIDNYNLQELIILITLSVLLLVALIALFNFDWLNDAIFRFHRSIEKKHATTNSRFMRIILSAYKYPGKIPQGIKHDGWKGGVTFLTSAVSTFVIGITAFYVISTIISILVTIFIIGVILIVIGALFGR